MSDDEPELRYVPGAHNHYKSDHNVVVLDERLKDYPEAHDYILQHELEHAKPENKTFLGLLRHEFQTDVRRYFGTDEEIEAVRTYLEEREPAIERGPVTTAKYSAAHFLRGLWELFMSGGSALCRFARTVMRDE